MTRIQLISQVVTCSSRLLWKVLVPFTLKGVSFLPRLQHRARHFYSQAMMISNPTRLPLSVYYARILSTIIHVDSAHSIQDN